MNVSVLFTPGEVQDGDLVDRVAIVIDVLRATSTVVEALANGAKAIYPTVSIEEAIRLASSLGRPETLLCGERRGLMIDGFDLGNSPAEFNADRVEGAGIVMCTTNGTRALVAADGADQVYAASFLNLGAVVEVVGAADDVVIICAGKADLFALDDAVCAGHIIQRLRSASDGLVLNDAAKAALRLSRTFKPTARFLGGTEAGTALTDAGLASDLPLCARLDEHWIVPEMHERVIRVVERDR